MIDEHPVPSESDRATIAPEVLFEDRRQIDYGNRWDLLWLFWLLHASSDLLEARREGDRLEATVNAVGIALFTLFGAILLIDYLRRRHQGPDRQPRLHSQSFVEKHDSLLFWMATTLLIASFVFRLWTELAGWH